MKKSDFQKLLLTTFESLQVLTASKGEEYSRSNDQLANFYRFADDAGASPFVVWLVLFSKHVDAIKSFTKTGRSLSEPIEGRVDDAILYLVLLKALIKEDATLAAALFPEPGEGSGND